MASQPNPTEELKVFISNRESTCGECNENLGSKAWITLAGEKGALCLACADLDHLVFLPSGDAALTRRAKKHSTLSAVVLKWSRARKRYERQGLLVEEQALEKAEEECLADAEVRERRKEREAIRREESDGRRALKWRRMFVASWADGKRKGSEDQRLSPAPLLCSSSSIALSTSCVLRLTCAPSANIPRPRMA